MGSGLAPAGRAESWGLPGLPLPPVMGAPLPVCLLDSFFRVWFFAVSLLQSRTEQFVTRSGAREQHGRAEGEESVPCPDQCRVARGCFSRPAGVLRHEMQSHWHVLMHAHAVTVLVCACMYECAHAYAQVHLYAYSQHTHVRA